MIRQQRISRAITRVIATLLSLSILIDIGNFKIWCDGKTICNEFVGTWRIEVGYHGPYRWSEEARIILLEGCFINRYVIYIYTAYNEWKMSELQASEYGY